MSIHTFVQNLPLPSGLSFNNIRKGAFIVRLVALLVLIGVGDLVSKIVFSLASLDGVRNPTGCVAINPKSLHRARKLSWFPSNSFRKAYRFDCEALRFVEFFLPKSDVLLSHNFVKLLLRWKLSTFDKIALWASKESTELELVRFFLKRFSDDDNISVAASTEESSLSSRDTSLSLSSLSVSSSSLCCRRRNCCVLFIELIARNESKASKKHLISDSLFYCCIGGKKMTTLIVSYKKVVQYLLLLQVIIYTVQGAWSWKPASPFSLVYFAAPSRASFEKQFKLYFSLY